MKPEVKKFTRENPCTKLDIWNCFRARRGFKTVPVVEAQSIIGANAPRVMLRNGYIEAGTKKDVDTYTLTDQGKVWLTKGMVAYLKNHPEQRIMANYLPKMFTN